jgi:hypothetical protein
MRRIGGIVVAIVLVFASPAAAQDVPLGGTEASPGVTPVTTLPEPGAVSARAKGDRLYVSTITGVSIYDITNPRAPIRMGRIDIRNAQNEDVDVGDGILLVSDDPHGWRGLLHVVDVRDPTRPHVVGTLRTWTRGIFAKGRRGNDQPRKGGIGHTATCIDACRWAYLAGSTAGIDIVDLRNPAKPRIAGRFAAREAAGGNGTHDVEQDAQGIAWVTGGSGTAGYDVSNPLRPRLLYSTGRRARHGPLNGLIHHNSMRLPGRVVAVTEEDFGDRCRSAGSFQTWSFGGHGRQMSVLDTFEVERDPWSRLICSAHWFDIRDGLVAQGYYEAGLRLLDVRDPRNIRQVGFWVPQAGLIWAAVFAPTDPTGSTVYAVDHQAGIQVVALDRAALRPVTRLPVARPPRGNIALAIIDGWDEVKPGQRIELAFVIARGKGFGAYTRGSRLGRVSVEATLPRALVDVRPPRGATWDPATRRLTFTVPSVSRYRVSRVAATIARNVPLGRHIEVMGFARADGDALILDGFAADESDVGRRAESAFPVKGPSAAAAWLSSGPQTAYALCRL